MRISAFKRLHPRIADALRIFGVTDAEYIARYNANLPPLYVTTNGTLPPPDPRRLEPDVPFELDGGQVVYTVTGDML